MKKGNTYSAQNKVIQPRKNNPTPPNQIHRVLRIVYRIRKN